MEGRRHSHRPVTIEEIVLKPEVETAWTELLRVMRELRSSGAEMKAKAPPDAILDELDNGGRRIQWRPLGSQIKAKIIFLPDIDAETEAIPEERTVVRRDKGLLTIGSRVPKVGNCYLLIHRFQHWTYKCLDVH